MYRLTPQQVMTSFVGRDRDAEAVTDLLVRSDVRIVTLTGPGGVGKTRLAFHVADQLKATFSDGMVTVDLASITTPDLVLPAIARGLGITDSGADSIMHRMLRAVGDRRFLFLIDNFEQVAEAGTVVSSLLSQLPNCSFLVTSRMPLHIIGEYEYAVSSLEVPESDHATGDARELLDYPAVKLFVQRAQAVHRAFEPTSEMLEAIGKITVLLDGLPLAIELAAARTKLFSLQALLARLNDRLALLTGGPRDLPHRLQTMRDAISWSYDLLSGEERIVFRRISAFSGSFSLQAAEAVVAGPITDEERTFIESKGGRPEYTQGTPDLLHHLHSLLDKSLLQLVPGIRDDVRFRMMLTIQEYALDQLDRHDELLLMRLRILQYFSSHLQELDEPIKGAEQRIILAQLDHEVGNIRQALHTSLEHPRAFGEAGVQLATTMWRYWLVRGQPSEGARWLEDTLMCRSEIELAAVVEARALNCLGNLRLDLGNHAAASELYRESLSIYRSVNYAEGIADELNNLGLVLLIEGKPEQARQSLEESLAIFRKDENPEVLPWTLANLGDVAIFLENYDLAETYHAEGLKIVRGTGNVRRIAFSCYSLGTIAYFREEFDHAQAWFDEGLEYQAQLDDAYSLGLIMLGLGRLNLATGNAILASERLRRALEVLQRMGSRRIMIEVIDVIAIAAERFGFFREAARLLGTIHSVRVEQHVGVSPWAERNTGRVIASLVRTLGDEGFSRQFMVGERQLLNQAVEEAMSLTEAVRDRAESGDLDELAGNGAFDPAMAVSRAKALGLTKRERQVLELLVKGASDKEIADVLSIAPRTAMTHVSNILAKLDVNRRTAAASFALREGLVDPAQVGEVQDV